MYAVRRLDILPALSFVSAVVARVKGNEAHEHSVASDSYPELVRNPDRSDSSTACGFLIGKHFPIQATLSPPF